jgi:hypothetical protein
MYSDAPEMPADEHMEEAVSMPLRMRPAHLPTQRQQHQQRHQHAARLTASLQPDPDIDPVEQEVELDDDPQEDDSADSDNSEEQNVDGDGEEVIAEVEALRQDGVHPDRSSNYMEIDEPRDEASSGGGGSSQATSAVSTSRSSVVSAGRVVSVPLVDERAQAELRRKIMEIQRNPKISFPEKAGLIQVCDQL